MAIDNICDAESKKYNIKVKQVTLSEAFKDADENHDDIILEATVNGLDWLLEPVVF